jgi:hypothetical protein
MSSIYFERQDGKKSPQRAYTHVDYATAKVGNRWLERSWSRFMGTTNSLIEKESEREWVSANNPEFKIETDGVPLGPMELGDTNFSDTVNDLGAVITLEKSNPELVFTAETTAFHDKPVLVRKVSLRNLTDSPKVVRSIASEAITLDSNDVRFLTQFFSKEESGVIADTKETTIGIEWGEDGLLVGKMGEGNFDLGHSESQTCQIIVPIHNELQPGETREFGRTMLMLYQGDPLDFANTQIPDVVKRIQDFESAEQRKADELKEEEST